MSIATNIVQVLKLGRDSICKGSMNRRKSAWKKCDRIKIIAEVHKEKLLI
jgi:hypothetical protein